uniref:Protection of telomeres protein 1 n=1 Tax=Strongyloides stercoralis TaxID=6248 RepID=A0A0K0E622_STRER
MSSNKEVIEVACCTIRPLSLKPINNGFIKILVFEMLNFHDTDKERDDFESTVFYISLDEKYYLKNILTDRRQKYLLYFNSKKHTALNIFLDNYDDFTIINSNCEIFPNDNFYRKMISPQDYLNHWPYRWNFIIRNYCEINDSIIKNSHFITSMTEGYSDKSYSILCQILFKGELKDQNKKVIRVWDGTTYNLPQKQIISNNFFKNLIDKCDLFTGNEDIKIDFTETKYFSTKTSPLAIDIIIDLGNNYTDEFYNNLEVGDFLFIDNITKTFKYNNNIFEVSYKEAKFPIVYSIYKSYTHPLLTKEFNILCLSSQNYTLYIDGNYINYPITKMGGITNVDLEGKKNYLHQVKININLPTKKIDQESIFHTSNVHYENKYLLIQKYLNKILNLNIKKSLELIDFIQLKPLLFSIILTKKILNHQDEFYNFHTSNINNYIPQQEVRINKRRNSLSEEEDSKKTKMTCQSPS